MTFWLNGSLPWSHFPDDYYTLGETGFSNVATTTMSSVNMMSSSVLGLGQQPWINYFNTGEYENGSIYKGENPSDLGKNDGFSDLGGTDSDFETWSVTTENYLLSGLDMCMFDKKNLKHSLGWTITLIIAYMLILVIGIIGNCMVILVVVLRPQMRTVTNMFIMNLAVADLFVIVFCVPPTLLANILDCWILGSFMCKAVAYVQGVSVCASAYSLAAISLDRCKAIYRPMERPCGLSKSQALCTICLIWIAALLMTLPWVVVFDVIRSDEDGLTFCHESWSNENHGKVYFLVANLIFCYSLPLVLISLSNVVIWCHVARRKVPQDSASVGNIKRMHRRTRHGVRKMLGIVTLAFLISWLPLYVLATRLKFSESIGESEASLLAILMPFAQWLGSWNSSVNPVLYAFLNSKFRESFKSLMPMWMQRMCLPNKVRARGAHHHATVTTNGTAGTCATATPSFATMYTTRSSGRSSRGVHHKSGSNRSMLVSNPRAATSTTTVPMGTGNNVCCVVSLAPTTATVTDL